MISCCLWIRVLVCLFVGSEAVLREVTDGYAGPPPSYAIHQRAAAQRATHEGAPPTYDSYGVAKSTVVLDADEAKAVRILFGKAAARQPGNVCNWEGVKCYKSGHLDEEMDLDHVEGVSECAKALAHLQKRAIASPRGKSLPNYKILPWLTGVRELSGTDKKVMNFRMQFRGFPIITASGSNPTSPQGSPGSSDYDSPYKGFHRTELYRLAKEIREPEQYKHWGYVLYDEKGDNEFATSFGMDMVREEVHWACERDETDSDEDKQLKDSFWRAVWEMFVQSWDLRDRYTKRFFVGLEGPLDKFEQTDMYKYILPVVRSYQLPRKEWKAKIYVMPCTDQFSTTCASATCADYIKANYFQKLSGTCTDCDRGVLAQGPTPHVKKWYHGNLRRCLGHKVKKTYLKDGEVVEKGLFKKLFG